MSSASLRNKSSADIRDMGHLIKKHKLWNRLYISSPFMSSGRASREQEMLVIAIKIASPHRSPGPGPWTARAEHLREVSADATKPSSSCLE